MSQSSIAVYAFSGDPITYGHLDIIKRARKLFGKVIVAIGTNPDKTYTFSAQKREQLTKQALVGLKGVIVKQFDGLLVDFAYEQAATTIIKGVRDANDFQYEQNLNSVGLSQHHGLETIILFADPALAHISSSTVKALQKSQGLAQEYVPLPVKVALEKELSQQTIIGITGEEGSGKTYLAEKIIELGKREGQEVHNIELDSLAHKIQEKLNQPQYKIIRKRIVKEFGSSVQKEDGSINRKKLGEMVFADREKLTTLNKIMWQPVLVRLRRALLNKKGLIIINAALLAEANLLTVCNNQIILVKTNKTTQQQRLKKRGLSVAQINRRLKSQYSTAKKQRLIKESLAKHSFGTLWQVTEKTAIPSLAKKLFKTV